METTNERLTGILKDSEKELCGLREETIELEKLFAAAELKVILSTCVSIFNSKERQNREAHRALSVAQAVCTYFFSLLDHHLICRIADIQIIHRLV
jgi:hypothetical protein